MLRKPKAIVKLQISAGAATPAPPIGPSLAQYGINISEFCKKFNDQTQNQKGWIIPVEIKVFEDRSYEFILKQPPASDLLRKAAGIEKGSGEPNRVKIGSITRAQLKEIVQRKMEDLNTKDVEKAMKIIEGTARSMGITIE